MAAKGKRAAGKKVKPALAPANHSGVLEAAIGREVHAFRRKHGMTVVDLARLAKLSPGMLSKIENGLTSPSLATLRALSTALGVPVTAFFRRFEQHTDATFVRAGEGLVILPGVRESFSGMPVPV